MIETYWKDCTEIQWSAYFSDDYLGNVANVHLQDDKWADIKEVTNWYKHQANFFDV